MKKILILILLFTSFPIYSQTMLNGKYTMAKEKHVIYMAQEIFWFDSSGQFKYIDASDVGIAEGRGFYKIKDKKLTLYFINSDTTTPYVKYDYKISGVKELEDSMIYNLKVIDYDTSDPLVGSLAIISYVDNGKERKLTDAEVDIFGNAILKFSKDFVPVTLKVSYIGYHQFVYDISDNKSRNMDIILNDDLGSFLIYYDENDTLTYEIEYFSNDSFLLKDLKSHYWTFYNKTGEYNDK